MKYVVFLGDGMSDQPMAELNGRTPLMVAHTPHLDRMVRDGIGGWSRNTPDGYYPGSDIANMGVLGYDVSVSYSGRSPLEAAAMGIELGTEDVAFRCNLVTLSPDCQTMVDFSAGHITSAEGAEIIFDLNRHLGSAQFQFYPGVSYRHLLVWRQGREAIQCRPPHDITDQAIADHLPQGEDSGIIRELMERSWEFLANHPVNRRRQAAGAAMANSIWLWGHGRRPSLALFRDRYGISGGVISAVDLMGGIAMAIGMERIRVAGATGWIDTNYAGKAQACLAGLQRHDLIFVHVEAPDEAGHAGRLDYKIQAIADLDALVIGPVLAALDHGGEPYRALALPDHPTPVQLRTHTSEPVPLALYGTGISADANQCYDETLLQTGSLRFDPGREMMGYFLRKN